MRESVKAFIVAVAVAMFGAVLAQGTASATATSPKPSPGTGTETAAATLAADDVLRLNPEAKRVDDYTVRIADGVNLLLPRPAGSVGTQHWAGCNYATGHLCVWDNASYSGYALDFYWCDADDLNLGNLRYPDGAKVSPSDPSPRWNDRISSINNHQTTGTRANFYNWENGAWKLVFWTYAPDRRTNLAIDKRYDNGGPLNDIIDRVYPC